METTAPEPTTEGTPPSLLPDLVNNDMFDDEDDDDPDDVDYKPVLLELQIPFLLTTN